MEIDTILKIREGMEILSEKSRYKIILTLLASRGPLSFSQLKKKLPSIAENNLNHHLIVLKDNGFVENMKKEGAKRDEPRSFYLLSEKTLDLLIKLGLGEIKHELSDLFDVLD